MGHIETVLIHKVFNLEIVALWKHIKYCEMWTLSQIKVHEVKGNNHIAVKNVWDFVNIEKPYKGENFFAKCSSILCI